MADKDIYVTAALKTTVKNQAIIFMKNEYVVEDYAPGSFHDKISIGPKNIKKEPTIISKGLSSLKKTIFAEKGIECAFASTEKDGGKEGVAYIFSDNQCTKWFYDANTGNSKILDGPKAIHQMFPFLTGTGFDEGIDAAFESNIDGEAYLFKGERYVLIKYGTKSSRIESDDFDEKWTCLKDTIYEKGFDAALATHDPNLVYLFKGENYARIDITNNKIINMAKIKDYWKGLGSILPRKNSNVVSN